MEKGVRKSYPFLYSTFRGYNLHCGVVSARNRKGLEGLCRYINIALYSSTTTCKRQTEKGGWK